MRTISKIISLLLLITVSFAFGFFCAWQYKQQLELPNLQASFNQGYQIGVQDGIKEPKSIGETQQNLRDLSFDIKVDYIWGPNTEKAFCDYKGIAGCKKAGM